MADRGHNGHQWRQIRKAVLSVEPLICFCGGAIDKRLPYPHPGSPSVDLIVPWSKGGSPLDINNLRPAHLAHNIGRGNRDTPPPRNRRWTSSDQP